MSALPLCTLTPCVKLSPLFPPNCGPSTIGRKLSSPRSPLLATLRSCVQAAENTATLSPFPATLTSNLKHKSFVCHSYKKHRGGVSLQPRYRPGGWLTEWTGRIPDTVNNGRREEEGAPMPWKVSSVMEEKLRFILEYEGGEESMKELCQRYEISRETGYVTLRRYRASGLSGLLAQSHAAQRHHNQTAEEIEEKVLELRQAHMRWGPRKLKRILERDEPERNWPASSTIGALLKREGLVVARKKRLHTAPYTEPLAHAEEA